MSGSVHVNLVVVPGDHDARRIAPKAERLKHPVQLLDSQRATNVKEVPKKEDASSARMRFGVRSGQHLLAHSQCSMRNVEV
jgi:hypothetical protein